MRERKRERDRANEKVAGYNMNTLGLRMGVTGEEIESREHSR